MCSGGSLAASSYQRYGRSKIALFRPHFGPYFIYLFKTFESSLVPIEGISSC